MHHTQRAIVLPFPQRPFHAYGHRPRLWNASLGQSFGQSWEPLPEKWQPRKYSTEDESGAKDGRRYFSKLSMIAGQVSVCRSYIERQPFETEHHTVQIPEWKRERSCSSSAT